MRLLISVVLLDTREFLFITIYLLFAEGLKMFVERLLETLMKPNGNIPCSRTLLNIISATSFFAALSLPLKSFNL
jgi:hypothetical protein